MIGCGAPSGELPLAEARSGKALLQVQVTHSEVYLSGAVARLLRCGSPRELRVSASSRLHAVFLLPGGRPGAWWERSGWGARRRQGTRKKKKKLHLQPLGIVGRTEGLRRAELRYPKPTGIKCAAHHTAFNVHLQRTAGQWQKSSGLKFTLCSEEGKTPGLLRNVIFNILTHNKHFSCPDVQKIPSRLQIFKEPSILSWAGHKGSGVVLVG